MRVAAADERCHWLHCNVGGALWKYFTTLVMTKTENGFVRTSCAFYRADYEGSLAGFPSLDIPN